MAITLTNANTTVSLPVDMIWTDRHSWSPVEQRAEFSITGAVILDVATKIAGRSITLTSDMDHGWLPHATLMQLKDWAALPGLEMTLSIDGTEYQVIFRHQDKPAVDMQEVVAYSIGDHADFYYGTLKLMEI